MTASKNMIRCPVCELNKEKNLERQGKEVDSYCSFCEGWGMVDKDEISETADNSISFWHKVKATIEASEFLDLEK